MASFSVEFGEASDGDADSGLDGASSTPSSPAYSPLRHNQVLPSSALVVLASSLDALARPAPPGMVADTRIRIWRNGGEYRLAHIDSRLVREVPATHAEQRWPAPHVAAVAETPSPAAVAPSPYRYAVPPPRPPSSSPSSSPPPSALFSPAHAAAAQRIHSKVVFSDEDEGGDGEESSDVSESESERPHQPPLTPRHDEDDEDMLHQDSSSDEGVDDESDEDDEDESKVYVPLAPQAARRSAEEFRQVNRTSSKLRAACSSQLNKCGVQNFRLFLKRARPGDDIFDLSPEELLELVPEWILTARTLTGTFYKWDTFKQYINSIQRVARLMEPKAAWANLAITEHPPIKELCEQQRRNERERDLAAARERADRERVTTPSKPGEMTTRRAERIANGEVPMSYAHLGYSPPSSAPSSPKHSAAATPQQAAPDLSSEGVLPQHRRGYHEKFTAEQEEFLISQLDPSHAEGLLRLNFINIERHVGVTFVEEHRSLTLREFLVASKRIAVKYQKPSAEDEAVMVDVDPAHATDMTPFEVCDPAEPGCAMRDVKFLMYVPARGARRGISFMYERPWEGALCPVALWLAYMSHRPPIVQVRTAGISAGDIEILMSVWLQPKRSYAFDSEWFYATTMLGRTKISSLIGNLAAAVGLPGIFSNHSIGHRPKYAIDVTPEEIERFREENRNCSYHVPTKEQHLAVQASMAAQEAAAAAAALPPPPSHLVPSLRQQMPPPPPPPARPSIGGPPPRVGGPSAPPLPGAPFGFPPLPPFPSVPPFQMPSFPPAPLSDAYARHPTFFPSDPAFLADQQRHLQLYAQLDESLQRRRAAEQQQPYSDAQHDQPSDLPPLVAPGDSAATSARAPAPAPAAFLQPLSLSLPSLAPSDLASAGSLLKFLDQFQGELRTLSSYAASCQSSVSTLQSLADTLRSESDATLKVTQQAAKIAQQFQLIQEQKFMIEQLTREKQELMKQRHSPHKEPAAAGPDAETKPVAMDLDSPPSPSPDSTAGLQGSLSALGAESSSSADSFANPSPSALASAVIVGDSKDAAPISVDFDHDDDADMPPPLVEQKPRSVELKPQFLNAPSANATSDIRTQDAASQ